jgi:hypothetical protein
VHTDFFGPLYSQYFLLVIDAYSKWPEVFATSGLGASVVINKLNYLVCRHGVFDILVSDNGPAFRSDELKQFLASLGILHLPSPEYHPATNGQAERYVQTKVNIRLILTLVQTLKSMLKKVPHSTWSKELPNILFTLRTTPSSTTGKTPAELMYGRKLRTVLDNFHPRYTRATPTPQTATPPTVAEHLGKLKPGDTIYVRSYKPKSTKFVPARFICHKGPRVIEAQLYNGEIIRRHLDQLNLAALKSPLPSPHTEVPSQLIQNTNTFPSIPATTTMGDSEPANQVISANGSTNIPHAMSPVHSPPRRATMSPVTSPQGTTTTTTSPQHLRCTARIITKPMRLIEEKE